jgi:PST family polysaccharide transporter
MKWLSHEGSESLFSNAEAHTLKSRSVRGAAVTMIGQGIRFTVQFGSQIAMARLLDPAQFGLIAMVAPVMAFVQVFNDLGLARATVQRPEINHRDISSLFWINLGASVALCLLLIAASPLIGAFYQEPRTVGITIALSFVLLLGGLSSQQMALLSRAMRFRQMAIIDIASMLATTCSGIVAALAGAGYWSLVVMPFAMMGTIVALSWFFTGWIPDRPRRNPHVGGMIRFGSHLTGASLLFFASRNVDNILIGWKYGSAALGLYDRGYKLMLLPLDQITAPAARVALPLLSRLQGDATRYRAAFLQMLNAIHLAAIPGMVAAIALSDQVILTLFGEKWAEVGPIFFWLAIAGLNSFMGTGSSWLFTSQNRTAELLRWECISAVLNVASFVIGLPDGALGVARAYAIVNIALQGPILWWLVTRQGPVGLRDLLRTAVVFTMAGGCSYAALYALGTRYEYHGVPGLIVGGGLSYAVSGIALAAMPEGRRILRGALAMRSVTGR